jgi:hypothetical protein
LTTLTPSRKGTRNLKETRKRQHLAQTSLMTLAHIKVHTNDASILESWRSLQWLRTLGIKDMTWLWLSRLTVIVYNRCYYKYWNAIFVICVIPNTWANTTFLLFLNITHNLKLTYHIKHFDIFKLYNLNIGLITTLHQNLFACGFWQLRKIIVVNLKRPSAWKIFLCGIHSAWLQVPRSSCHSNLERSVQISNYERFTNHFWKLS